MNRVDDSDHVNSFCGIRCAGAVAVQAIALRRRERRRRLDRYAASRARSSFRQHFVEAIRKAVRRAAGFAARADAHARASPRHGSRFTFILFSSDEQYRAYIKQHFPKVPYRPALVCARRRLARRVHVSQAGPGHRPAPRMHARVAARVAAGGAAVARRRDRQIFRGAGRPAGVRSSVFRRPQMEMEPAAGHGPHDRVARTARRPEPTWTPPITAIPGPGCIS